MMGSFLECTFMDTKVLQTQTVSRTLLVQKARLMCSCGCAKPKGLRAPHFSAPLFPSMSCSTSWLPPNTTASSDLLYWILSCSPSRSPPGAASSVSPALSLEFVCAHAPLRPGDAESLHHCHCPRVLCVSEPDTRLATRGPAGRSHQQEDSWQDTW